MSEEPTTPDLEGAIRRSVEAFHHGDFDGAVAIFRPDGVWDTSSMGTGVFEGREAIRDLFEYLLAWYDALEQEVEEVRDLGGVTFVVILQRTRPHGSSTVVVARYAYVSTWRDGLIERCRIYVEIDEARATAERLAEKRG